MKQLVYAFLVEILAPVIAIFINLFALPLILSVFVHILSIIIVWALIADDAKRRGISGFHGAWSLLGLLGLLLYVIFFALRHPVTSAEQKAAPNQPKPPAQPQQPKPL